MSELHLTKANFNEAIASGKALVDFWAGWCGPCRMLAPTITELADELAGKVTVAKVDIDAENALASQYGVMSIPTVILFENGVEVKRFVGVRSKAEYLSAL